MSNVKQEPDFSGAEFNWEYLIKKTAMLPWLICAFGAIFYCYEYFLRIAPSIMTGDLMRVYHINAGGLGDLNAFYLYAYTPMQLFVGIFMDRYGPRRLLSIACLFCAVGAVLFASGHSVGIAEIGRFLIGFGSAFAFVGTLKLATMWLPPHRFALVSGLAVALGMMGAVVGDNILAAIIHVSNWRTITFTSAGLGVLLAIVIYLVVRDNSTYMRSHVKQGDDAMSFGPVLKGLFGALKNPQMWINGIIGGLLYLPATAFAEFWGIPYLEARGFSTPEAASAISMVFIGWVVGGPIIGWFSDAIRNRRLPIFIGAVGSAAAILAVLYVPMSMTQVFIALFAFGFFSGGQILAFAVGRESCSMRLAGTGIALTNMLVMVCGAVFQPLIGHLLDQGWSGKVADHGLHVYSIANYQHALTSIPIAIIVAVVMLLALRETHAKPKD